jgi:hypothetical protein
MVVKFSLPEKNYFPTSAAILRPKSLALEIIEQSPK